MLMLPLDLLGGRAICMARPLAPQCDVQKSSGAPLAQSPLPRRHLLTPNGQMPGLEIASPIRGDTRASRLFTRVGARAAAAAQCASSSLAGVLLACL
jgi:hypothetical protein